ncbi:hypothetical protein PACTADRAFT_48471 [Pachysolen tannophilus NRRL Y-2460]|uniref:Altered inheritance of mitochondria protein 39, mitochondrial n=1 Tax=Pachysolen tannophilus NRRL Y-2460 TaxID=669874 RepID=A0A1E4TXZ3_PACTA|nr:hypothetical protein PACTADRAFT_48471 [Pachysolen tannophilus NRRL Y-2460]
MKKMIVINGSARQFYHLIGVGVGSRSSNCVYRFSEVLINKRFFGNCNYGNIYYNKRPQKFRLIQKLKSLYKQGSSFRYNSSENSKKDDHLSLASEIEKNRRKLLKETIENAIATNNIKREESKFSNFTKIGIFILPFFITIACYVAYQSLVKCEDSFIPLYISKRLEIDSENNYGIDLNKLQEHTELKIIEKISSNQKVKEKFGLPLIVHHCDKFKVFLQFENFIFSGINISFKDNKPSINWIRREVPIKEKFNDILDPIGINENPGDFHIQLMNENKAGLRDYSIITEGRIPIASNYNKSIKEGAVDFNAVIEFYHNQTIKITAAKLFYEEKDGNVVIEELW